MYLEDINAIAGETFSNYEGDGGDQYTGFGDDFMDFGGNAVSFANEMATDRIFSITLTNATAAAQTVFLNNDYSRANDSAGVVRDGVVLSANGADLTASGSPKTIANLLGYLAKNPTNVLALKITSNNTAQLAQTLEIMRQSPFRNLENELIILSSYTAETSTNDKMVTVRRPFQLDNQTTLSFQIPANTISTITFYFGATLNTAKALNSKSGRAGKHPQVSQMRAIAAGGK